MPKYTLHYFNAKGRAELPRLVFKAAGRDFEDVRYTQEEWPEAKPKMPLGQVPVLFIDDEPLTQGAAIAKYLAGEFGLYGKDSMERARIDESRECLNEMAFEFGKIYGMKDETRKAEMSKEYLENGLPKHMANFEKLLTRNNNGDGFCVGDKLSLADLTALFYFEMLPVLGEANILEKYPKIKAYNDRVVAVPNIAAWLEARPKTMF